MNLLNNSNASMGFVGALLYNSGDTVNCFGL
jgi:hypothetical protein